MVLGREEPSLRSPPSSRQEIRRKRRKVWALVPPAHPQALPLSGCPREPCLWGYGGLGLPQELSPALPPRCWVLGMRFSPSALGAPSDVAEQNSPGQGRICAWGEVGGLKQRGDAASEQLPHGCLLLQGPRMLNMTEKGKAGKIQLPRELFQSLSSQRVRVVVTVLNTQQLGMFKVWACKAALLWPPALAACRLGSGSIASSQEANQTGQVLDDTVVGIMVGETSISGLQDPVRLTFAHGQLPHVSQPCPPSLPPPCPSLRCRLMLLAPLAGRHPTMCLLGPQQRYSAWGARCRDGHGCCARHSGPSPCACHRAGRRLEKHRMCHAARGQGDSLLL